MGKGRVVIYLVARLDLNTVLNEQGSGHHITSLVMRYIDTQV
jgi:hypothetical protein